VLVAINEEEKAIEAGIAAGSFALGEAWETSDAHALEKVYEGPLGSYAFPPRSVTTLVLHRRNAQNNSKETASWQS
jgi:hypothetical protein